MAAALISGFGCNATPAAHNVAVFCDVPVGTPSPCATAIAATGSGAGGTPAVGLTSPTVAGTAGGASTTSVTPTATAEPGVGGSSGASGTAPVAMSSAGAGGAGGMAGAAPIGASGMGGSSGAGGDAAGSLKCPMEVCPALPMPSADAQAMAAAMGIMFMIENCCATTGDCGTSLNGAACIRTPDSNPQCPGLDAMGFMVPSCCTPDGQCGIDGSQFMMGCTDLATVDSMAGGFITVPPPKTCQPM